MRWTSFCDRGHGAYPDDPALRSLEAFGARPRRPVPASGGRGNPSLPWPRAGGTPCAVRPPDAHAGSWALRGYGTFIVRPRGEGEIVGTCGIFHSYRGFGAALGLDDVPEAGWIVRHDHHGQGVAREVMDAALAWFDAAHGPRRIACMIEEGNLPSRRLAERLGFTHYATHELEEGDEKVPLLLLERVAR